MLWEYKSGHLTLPGFGTKMGTKGWRRLIGNKIAQDPVYLLMCSSSALWGCPKSQVLSPPMPGKTISSFINKEEKEHILLLFIIQKLSENPSQILVPATMLIRPSTSYKNRDDPSLDAEARTIHTNSPCLQAHRTGGVQRTLSKFQCTREVSFLVYPVSGT